MSTECKTGLAAEKIFNLERENEQLQARYAELEIDKGGLYQALLDVREERDKAKIERDKWKERTENLANFNPDWDQLDAARESLREHMKLLKDYREEVARIESEKAQQQERIAELTKALITILHDHTGADGAVAWGNLAIIYAICRRALKQPTPHPAESENGNG